MDINSILKKYSNLNFVDRVQNPSNYPYLTNDDGAKMSHMMGYAQHGDQHIVYPTIIYNKDTNSLKMLEPKDAFEYAIKSQEFIPFNTPEDAEYFSQNYKLSPKFRQYYDIQNNGAGE